MSSATGSPFVVNTLSVPSHSTSTSSSDLLTSMSRLRSMSMSDATIRGRSGSCLQRRREQQRKINSLLFLLLQLRWTLLVSTLLIPVSLHMNGCLPVVVSASATTGSSSGPTGSSQTALSPRQGWLSTTREFSSLSFSARTQEMLASRSTRTQPSSLFKPVPITELLFLNPLSSSSSESTCRYRSHHRSHHTTRNANTNAYDIKPNQFLTSLASVKMRISSSTKETGAARRDKEAVTQRGAATATATGTATATFSSTSTATNQLVFWENMVCGATSRSIAQTIMHPANTMKTILQNARGPTATSISALVRPSNFRRLTVGAGANFLLSMPHGAVNFAVLELVRSRLSAFVQSVPMLAANEERFSFGLDFLSSTISTVTCSIVSTPQMMITDNIMAGNYPNLFAAVSGLASSRGVMGFYSGWWPGLVGKIPSYAFTWTFFQQLKNMRNRVTKSRPATDLENSAMGCLASATTVCLMIPMDTIKTRLVSQAGRAATADSYTGIINCAVRILREEGVATFYRGLPPRLVSVVPMIGIQFGVYEFMKRVMLQRRGDTDADRSTKPSSKLANSNNSNNEERTPTTPSVLEEAMIEVAASPDNPLPAPQFIMRDATKRDATKAPKR